MPPVTVVVPWRPSESRIPAFEFVVDWYARLLPEFAIRTIDTDDDVFVLAACRNRGIAAVDPDEVVVVCDADTLPEPEPLRAAVELAKGEACTSELVARGFYDQSHSIREIKRFTGVTPTRITGDLTELTRLTMKRTEFAGQVAPLVAEA